MEDAVRRGLSTAEQRTTDRYTVIAAGRGGLRPGVALSSNAAVAEALDDGSPLDALR